MTPIIVLLDPRPRRVESRCVGREHEVAIERDLFVREHHRGLSVVPRDTNLMRRRFHVDEPARERETNGK